MLQLRRLLPRDRAMGTPRPAEVKRASGAGSARVWDATNRNGDRHPWFSAARAAQRSIASPLVADEVDLGWSGTPQCRATLCPWRWSESSRPGSASCRRGCMNLDCAVCGISHEPVLHEAIASLRVWFRDQVVLGSQVGQRGWSSSICHYERPSSGRTGTPIAHPRSCHR